MGEFNDVARVMRVYWALLVGNVVEWYEFAVYGYLEHYIKASFFQGSAMATWLGFTVTFLARPLGGAALGVLGDVFGRRTAMNLSILGMLIGTCGQGLLPTYDSGSNALGLLGVIVLVMLRFLQGLSAAGEVSTICTYFTEVGSRKTVGRAVSFIALTINFGFLCAKAVVYTFSSVLGEEAMQSWGWRVPFIFAVLPGSIAVWGRRGLPESPEFLEEKSRNEEAMKAAHESKEEQADLDDAAMSKTSSRPPAASSRPSVVGGVLRFHGHKVFIGMLSVAAVAVLQYGGFMWGQSYLMKQGLSPTGRMLADVCARGLMIALALPVGWLTDVQGVAWVTLVGAFLLAVGGLPLFAILAAHPADLAVVIPVYGVALAAMGALAGSTCSYFVTELFPTIVRAAGMGIAFNLGFSIFGGLAPVLFQASLAVSPIGPGFLLSAGGAISASTVAVSVCLHRRGVVRLVHVRPHPYFASCGACEGEDPASPAGKKEEDVGDNSLSNAVQEDQADGRHPQALDPPGSAAVACISVP